MCELCSGISRRTFLGASTALSGGLLFSSLSASATAAPDLTGEWSKQPPVRIYVVYLGTQGFYPRPSFDSSAAIQQVYAPCLEAAAKKLGDVEFIGKDHIANDPNAANQLLPKIVEQNADAVLVIHLTAGWSQPFDIFASTGLPVAVYSQPLAGHDWGHVPFKQRNGAKIIMSVSRDRNEIQRLAGLLRAPVRMKSARLIVVGVPGCADGSPAACDYAKIKEKFGTEIVHITPEEVIDVFQTITDEEAVAEAENYWIKPAKEVREPNREEIIKACKVHFALKRLMIQHQSRTITVKCLGGIIENIGFPCLSLCRTLDDGGVGTCQADMDAALTMMLMLYATGLPGFMFNMNLDMSLNAIIGVHCVAPTKMDGPQSERLPFAVRSHTETERGVALEVLMDRDADREMTWARLSNNNEILVGTGIMRGGYDFEDRGCRTRFIAEVTSSTARELFENLSGNVTGMPWVPLLHRIMFYGNHMDNFRDLAQLMELKFMIEGKDMA
ncbi:MAG: hypothetical protein FWH27_17340 [Planctomycetaceae bacterium]|nr:hypothetical protein [Planctomycetaceae bacterium]